MKNEAKTLETCLDELDQISNEQWISNLEDRKKKELEFHDMHRKENAHKKAANEHAHMDEYEKLYGNKKYYSATDRSRKYNIDWIKKNAPGKIFLDYACGDGENAIIAAQNGAELAIGIDLSRVSIENARAAAREAGVEDKVRFVQADAEDTKLPSDSVDLVMCCGVLHHLDLSYAFPEIRRVMKKGGKLFALEALDYNPAIKLYRLLTPEMRTDWEKRHILDMQDIKFAKRFFNVDRVKFWHITGILMPHVPPPIAKFLDKLDSLIEKIPYLNLMAWIFTFELSKPEANDPKK